MSNVITMPARRDDHVYNLTDPAEVISIFEHVFDRWCAEEVYRRTQLPRHMALVLGQAQDECRSGDSASGVPDSGPEESGGRVRSSATSQRSPANAPGAFQRLGQAQALMESASARTPDGDAA